VRILKRVSIIAAWMLVIVVGILIVGYLGGSIMIGLGINKESRSAMARFSGDRIEALIALVDCQDCRLEDRNHAVWALGQLGDKRALPVLYKYRTGKPCDHSRQICQSEISKAVRWTEGNAYMLPQIWRVMVRDDRRPAAKNNPS
jgi:PBS lyase HEAT-like repeat